MKTLCVLVLICASASAAEYKLGTRPAYDLAAPPAVEPDVSAIMAVAVLDLGETALAPHAATGSTGSAACADGSCSASAGPVRRLVHARPVRRVLGLFRGFFRRCRGGGCG